MNLRTEPVAIGGITAAGVVAVVVAALAIVDVDLDEEDQRNLLAVVGFLLPLALAWWARRRVVSPQSAADAVIRAKQDSSLTPTVPAIAGPAGAAYAEAVKGQGFTPKPPAVPNP